MGTTEPAQPGWPSQPTWPALPAYQPAASPPWQPPLPQQGWNGPSIVGFILSVYPVVPLVGSVVAVVLGFVGNAQAKRQHERGSGLAKWAIGLGTFGVVATVAVVVALLISAAGVVQAIVNNSDARQDLDNSVVAAKTYYAVEGTYAGLTPHGWIPSTAASRTPPVAWAPQPRDRGAHRPLNGRGRRRQAGGVRGLRRWVGQPL